MFYIKERLNDTVEVNVNITEDNVFCRCPECGCEVKVNLRALSTGTNIFDVYVLCEDCSHKYIREHAHD